jgi:hypothetical protein
MWMSFARTEEAIQKSLDESPAPTGDCTVKYMSGERPGPTAFFPNVADSTP